MVRVGVIAVFSALALTPRALADAFVNVSAERGITTPLVSGASGKRYLPETMLGGAGWIDFDGDGWLDLYLIQGHDRPDAALDGPGSTANVLLRSVRGERFEDVTSSAGVGDRGYGMGVAVGDFDGDGRDDLYVTNYGRNTLYRNLGGGRFDDVTDAAGVGCPPWSTSATWFDFDGDGRLDLWVTNYLDYDTRKHAACEAKVSGRKVPAYCNPRHFDGVADVLYRNAGDGHFVDVSRTVGIASTRGWQESKGLGVVASDFDGDGHVDVFVANDSVPNALWRNDGQGRFENVALEVGFALNGDGATEACMGIARGDSDGDGTIDYFVTNFSRETNTLFANGKSGFRDITIARRLARAGYLELAFGTVFLDHDLDGDLDLYIANGHILDNAEALHPREGITYRQADLLLENTGTRYRDVSESSGAWFREKHASRAVAAADFDNDGDLDLLVTRLGDVPALLENRAADGRPWAGLRLEGSPGAPVIQNARVEIVSGGTTSVFEVQTDGSYLAAHDARIRVPLAPGATARARVRWSGGSRATVEVPALSSRKYGVVRREAP